MRYKSSFLAVALAAALALASPLSAQTDVRSGVSLDIETIRDMLIFGFEQNKQMDMEFCRSVPDSALRWAPTPEVRDFAQQIEHAAITNALIVEQGLGIVAPTFGDTAVYLNDRQALEDLAAASYDWVIESLRSLPSGDLVRETQLFGQTMAVWRVYLFALEHAYWTRGQMVPYFRAHGMRPPGFRPF